MVTEEKILVTGAGGFIGGWIVETLFLSGCPHVRAGIHTWAGAARLARFPLDITPCDIHDPAQLRSALSGIDCVIHCAKGPDYAGIPVETRDLLEASLLQGVKRFVHISTADVYGGGTTGTISEIHPLRKTGNPYADAKIEAELQCRDYLAKGLPVVIIRPPIVFGPFSMTWTLDIAAKLQSGEWGTFEQYGDGTCNLLYVSDLVSAVLSCLGCDAAVGEAFNINGCDPPTWNEYFQAFNDNLGMPPLKSIRRRQAQFQVGLTDPLRAAARFARQHFESPIRATASRYPALKGILKYLETTLKTTPRPADLRLYNRKVYYDDQKARRLLEYKPNVDLATGLQLSCAWLEQVGLSTSRAHTL